MIIPPVSVSVTPPGWISSTIPESDKGGEILEKRWMIRALDGDEDKSEGKRAEREDEDESEFRL